MAVAEGEGKLGEKEDLISLVQFTGIATAVFPVCPRCTVCIIYPPPSLLAPYPNLLRSSRIGGGHQSVRSCCVCVCPSFLTALLRLGGCRRVSLGRRCQLCCRCRCVSARGLSLVALLALVLMTLVAVLMAMLVPMLVGVTALCPPTQGSLLRRRMSPTTSSPNRFSGLR